MVSSLIIIIVAIIFSAFFSGMEVAFFTSNKLRLELDKKQGSINSAIISIFTDNPGHYISTMLVGNSIALVVYGIEVAKILNPIVVQHITSSVPTGLLLQIILSAFVILVTSELLPKTLFRQYPNALLTTFAPVVMFFYIIFYPINKLVAWLSYVIIRFVLRKKIARNTSVRVFHKADLDNLVEQATSDTGIKGKHGQELRIFQNALDFSEVRIRDCMIPRTDIEAVDISEDISILKRKFVETKYSRIPVFTDTIDNIVGYVNSKELFRKPQSVQSNMKSIEYFPETMFANKALAYFIKEQRSIAVVVDEFGGTAGLITIEDIMEEIFGEIDDEHDQNEFAERAISANEFVLSGRLEITYLNEKYALGIPESDEYDTLAGFILNRHQNIPSTNQIIVLDDFRVRIIKMKEARIDLVHLTKE